MSHFAKIENNIVTRVIVAEQDFIDDLVKKNPNEIWVQTSYNTHAGIHYDEKSKPSIDQGKALRKNYAGTGYFYCTIRDAFIPQKPYKSWNLNENTCLWEPPIPYPSVYSYEDESSNKQIFRVKWYEEKLMWIAAKGTTEKDIFKKKMIYNIYWDQISSSWKNLDENIIETFI